MQWQTNRRMISREVERLTDELEQKRNRTANNRRDSELERRESSETKRTAIYYVGWVIKDKE